MLQIGGCGRFESMLTKHNRFANHFPIDSAKNRAPTPWNGDLADFDDFDDFSQKWHF
jgi:hypothetical protein